MTTVVATIPAAATVRDAARLMLERGVSALPVMDRKNRVVGIVSEGDLVRRAEIGTDAPRAWWLGLFAERAARDYLKAHGALVRDVMTSPVVSARHTTPLAEIAHLLEKHRIKRVPVLEAGRLVGIVSRVDLVRQLVTSRAASRVTARTAKDRALRREVLENLERSGADLRYVNATVEHGVVHLWGSLPSRSQQKALRLAAKSIDGVRKVEDHTAVMPLAVATGLGLI
jgi:CBS domain-containing protein